jgi:DNA (cytosine-5)-methyltransferase 1
LQRHIEASGKTRKGVAADAEGGARGGCWWDGGQVSQTLDAVLSKGQTMPEKNRFPAVLQPTTVRSGSIGGFVQDNVGGTMRANGGDYHGGSESLVVWPAEVAATLDRSSKNSGGPGGSNQEIFSQHGANLVPQPVPYDLFQITAPVNRQNRKPGDPCHTLARDNAAHAAVAFHPLQDPISSTDGSTHCMGTGSSRGDATIAVAVAPSQRCNTPAVAFTDAGQGQRIRLVDESSETLRSTKRGPYSDYYNAMTVRRLTPIECEFLQGFPRNYTLIPWRGKPAEQCPDGPRYKALGNSMACNCMAWIGEKIAKWEAEHER